MPATDELVQSETRERGRVAVFAGLAALFTLAAPGIGLLVLKDAPDNLPGEAIYRSHHELGLALSSLCSMLGLVAIVLVLDFLYRATRARNPQLPNAIRPVAVFGGLGLAVLTLVLQIVTMTRLDHFATHGTQTYDEAQAATDFGGIVYIGLIAQLAFAFAIVMLSINAMRVGLLTRFLGYLGVISAVLFIIPLVPLPIVQIYWLGSLGLLFADRAPSGMPPAWAQGEAVPWPSSAEMREARVRAAEERRDGSDRLAEPSSAPGPGASRRKRKKRYR